MPELPEVESVRRGLDAYVVGGRIDDSFVYNARAVRRQPGGAYPARQSQGQVHHRGR